MRSNIIHLISAGSLAVSVACGGDQATDPERATVVRLTLSDSAGRYEVDTKAGLIFTINKANGDMVSLKYRGVELQDQTKFSGIASGLGSATVTAATADDGKVVTITCVTPTLTHYYVARGGTSGVFMATYTTAEPTVGELRYIARLDKTTLPNGNPNAEISRAPSTVEGTDVFAMDNGETRSKYYNNPRAMENLVHGVSGTGVAAYMIMGNRETSSGGPFFRDINNQGGTQQELYNYMNSGHTQTDAAYRMGLHGPYALIVTSGEAPNADLDMSWMTPLGLQGWVRDRGRVTGAVTGIPPGIAVVIGWANPTAQYWATPSAGTGAFTSPPMIPGTYTMTVYKKELALSTVPVTVGTTTIAQNAAYAEPDRPFVFRIGEFDGTPEGFRNASLIVNMHPSDVRMTAWGPLTYTVGTSPLTDFPMAQFKTVNEPTTIRFTLTQAQVTAHTLRVAVTLAFAGARPVVTVNPGTPQAFTSPIPPASNSTQPNSRGVTRGTWRGNNTEYVFDVPATAFIVGANTLTISAVSGSAGTGFLSPNLVYDAVQLDR